MKFLTPTGGWDEQQAAATTHIHETMELTTLAMKAAAFGREVLTYSEWSRLLKWYGFDAEAYRMFRS